MSKLLRIRVSAAVLLIVLLLPLCACRPIIDPNYHAADETPPAAATPVPRLSGSWIAYADAGDELMDALGLELAPYLDAPLLAELRLRVAEDGSCELCRDCAGCAELLVPAVAALVRDMQARELREPVTDAALTAALGADPEAFAAALVDEQLPPAQTLRGRLSPDESSIVWEDGSISALRREDGALRVELPGQGELRFAPDGA